MEEIINQFFDVTVKGFMYAGIEATMKQETIPACALVLSVYTEIMGGYATGKLKDGHSSGLNYRRFMEYLGPAYIELDDELIKRKTSLHKEVRSKLVHELQPRSAHTIELTPSMTDKPGLEYPSFGDGQYCTIENGVKTLVCPPNRFLIFRLREYFRDFQYGIGKYHSDLMESMKSEDFEKHQLFDNLIDVLTIGQEQ